MQPEMNLPGMRKYFDNPGDALRTGKGAYATGSISLPGEFRKEMIVVFPRNGQNYIAYPTAPGVPIRKATTKEVDSVTMWRSI